MTRSRGRFSFILIYRNRRLLSVLNFMWDEEWKIPDQGEEDAVDLSGESRRRI